MQNRKNIFFTLFLAYMILLCFLLFVNDLNMNYMRYALEDKLIHFGAFFIGQLLILLSGNLRKPIRRICYLLFLILPVVAEIVQKFLPRRVSDYADMLAAYFGIFACLILWYVITIIYKFFFLKER